MKDAALAMLLDAIQAQDSAALWLADEQVGGLVLPRLRPRLIGLSNRVDVTRNLKQAGCDALCNDFDFSTLPNSEIQAVYYRVSKEKALAHHLLNAAAALLPAGGKLYLSGFKSEGWRGYVDRVAAQLAGEVVRSKGKGGAGLAEITKRRDPEQALPDDDYVRLRQINPGSEPALYSKPGVFGWQKIDRGSALLVEQLPAFLRRFAAPPERILDLGCGYGYLTVMANAVHPGFYLATDNNAGALIACQHNMAVHGIRGEAILADCADAIDTPVGAILCNPPFHRGFDVRGDLTSAFLAATHRLLTPGGCALFVVNQFIGLESKAGEFARVETVAQEAGFKLVVLVR